MDIIISALVILVVYLFVTYINKKDNQSITINKKDYIVLFIIGLVIIRFISISTNGVTEILYKVFAVYLIVTAYIDIKTLYIYSVTNIVFIIPILLLMITQYNKLDIQNTLIASIVLIAFIILNFFFRMMESGDLEVMIISSLILCTKHIGYTNLSELQLIYEIILNPITLFIMLSIIIGGILGIARIVSRGLKGMNEPVAFSPILAASSLVILILF